MNAEANGPFVDRRATRAIVDLDMYATNVRLIRSRLAPHVDLMAIVKANAYGHGARLIARTALAAGASDLGVATVGEGIQLRQFGIVAPILILGPIQIAEAETALRFDLSITVADESVLDAVAHAARATRRAAPAAVHLKVDSGMRRFGANPEYALALASRLAVDPNVSFAGIFTHFAAADEPMATTTRDQVACFRALLTNLNERGIKPERVHAANSAALLTASGTHCDLARAGIALYGLRPSPRVPLVSGMRPVLTLTSRIARIFDVPSGDAVGYGGTYRAASDIRAALIPLGYADGYRRGLSNKGEMIAHGWRLPVIGRVSMDQTVVAIPAEADLEVGDAVCIVSSDPANDGPTAERLAELLDTISYEIVTGISTRVPRYYLRGGNVVASESLATGVVEFS